MIDENEEKDLDKVKEKKEISEEDLAEDLTCFSYDNMIVKKIILLSVKGYRFNCIGGDHISFINKEKEDKNETPSTSGWKFHISIDDSSEDAVKHAWDCLFPILIKHQIALTKILKIKKGKNDDIQQNIFRGRQFSIYANRNSEKEVEEWKSFFEEVTLAFLKNKINPGYINPACKQVKGSNFISYRNSQDKEENKDEYGNVLYVSCKKCLEISESNNSEAYNPFNREDTFKDIKLDGIIQPSLKINEENKEMDEIDTEKKENSCCPICIIN